MTDQTKTIFDKDRNPIPLVKQNGKWLDTAGNEYVFTLMGVFKVP
jgi:tetrahydromethanopterin S-methyltransferase subunit H